MGEGGSLRRGSSLFLRENGASLRIVLSQPPKGEQAPLCAESSLFLRRFLTLFVGASLPKVGTSHDPKVGTSHDPEVCTGLYTLGVYRAVYPRCVP